MQGSWIESYNGLQLYRENLIIQPNGVVWELTEHNDKFTIQDTTGATSANSVDVALLGMDMQQIIELTKTQPNFQYWS